MFVGGTLVAGVLAAAADDPWHGAADAAGRPGWVVGALALAGFFLAGNLALQFGATRLPANATA